MMKVKHSFKEKSAVCVSCLLFPVSLLIYILKKPMFSLEHVLSLSHFTSF